MTKNIVAKIDLILHATEDFQKIAEPLNDLFAIEKEEGTYCPRLKKPFQDAHQNEMVPNLEDAGPSQDDRQCVHHLSIPLDR